MGWNHQPVQSHMIRLLDPRSKHGGVKDAGVFFPSEGLIGDLGMEGP